MAKQCTGCGRIDNEPLGLNKHGEPYLACCPENNYKEITAVEWLVYQVNSDCLNSAFIRPELVMQAKAMEKSNMIGLLQWMNKVASETPMRLETDLDDIVEQYYNETYK